MDLDTQHITTRVVFGEELGWSAQRSSYRYPFPFIERKRSKLNLPLQCNMSSTKAEEK
jgi:hypothetical protein